MNSKQRRKASKQFSSPEPSLPPQLVQIPGSNQLVDTETLMNAMPVQNTLTEAVGYSWQGSNTGFPGGFSGRQIEDSTTIFENLRWYLVSNFRQMLSQAFVEIGLVQTIVCVPIDDGLRAGFVLKSKQLDEEQIKQLKLEMDREKDIDTAGWAAKWNRLFGGAGILILVDDQDPEEELDVDAIGENTEVDFRAVDMWELFWNKQSTEGYDPTTQEHEFEFYDYYAESVHKTRVMRLKGIEAPSFVRPRLRGWGVSVVETLVRSINQYLKSTDLSFEVLDEFKLDIYKIKNLVNTLLSPNGTAKVKERVQLANWQKNYQNAVVMDSEDDFDHKQLSFSGLAEAQAEIRMQVAADMRMPIVKLFGTGVKGGIGGTDQAEMENYNSMIESEVRGKLKFDILRIAEIRCQQLFGMIPDDLELEWNPLRELSALDQETVKTAKFTRLQQAKEAGEITTEEYRDACNKGNLFDVPLDTSKAGLKALDDEAQADAEAAASLAENVPGKDNESETSPKAKAKKENKLEPIPEPQINFAPHIPQFTTLDLMKRRVFNSAEFDKASYEADGGDAWIHPKRKEIFENPLNVDETLWAKAKEASVKALGDERWQFVVWFYKKQGGKFQ